MSDEQICQECGRIVGPAATSCPDCGWSFRTRRSRHADRADDRWQRLRDLGPLIKIVIGLAVLALIGYGVVYAFQRLWKDVAETSPYPASPVETARQFFTNLQMGDDIAYQECYTLLCPGRKAATLIGTQDRGSGYYAHFERIRRYLAKYAGDDFADHMLISPDGCDVEFPGGILITLSLESQMGLDDKPRYSLREVREFPIDAAPGMGIEQYNRTLNRAIENMGDVSGGGNADADLSEVIAQQPYENVTERLERLIRAYENSRQLDTRHELLLWLVKEFGADRRVLRLLRDVEKDQSCPPNLCDVAYDLLIALNQQP